MCLLVRIGESNSMRKRDVLTPVGITIGFIMIMLAIVLNGGREGLAIFIDIAAIFIVIGGLIGSLFINFKFEQMKSITKVMNEAFRKDDRDLHRLIHQFVHLSDKARKEGLLSLELELDEVEDKFIKKGILLAIDGMEPDVIVDIMHAEIKAMEERHYKGRLIIEKAGEYAPAWGMIGTLVGLILMLNNLDDPSSLGPSMAVALITTLYGTVLANLVFLPMASKLENRTDEEIFVREIIVEGILGIQSGLNPRILEEKLTAYLYGEKLKEKAKQVEEEHSYES